MRRVTETKPFKLLSENDPPAVRVVNPAGRAPVCLVCEHASAVIPQSLDDLGLLKSDRYSHAVWDIGAEKLALRLSELLDAPAVLGGVSRLVHDCNRPPERADAMPARVETINIPGNRDLSDAERQARVREVYDAFHRTLTDRLEGFAEPPALVTVHSFTPRWHSEPRTAEIGLLQDEDPALAQAMLRASEGAFRVELDVPYSAADGVTHMLARHGTRRGLQNVMIEVRNDLLTSENQMGEIAVELEGMLIAALALKGYAA